MPKSISIRLQDSDGAIYRWTIRHSPNSKPVGWEFTDHDGYTRFQEGNWYDLVARFKLSAENYGLSLLSDLS